MEYRISETDTGLREQIYALGMRKFTVLFGFKERRRAGGTLMKMPKGSKGSSPRRQAARKYNHPKRLRILEEEALGKRGREGGEGEEGVRKRGPTSNKSVAGEGGGGIEQGGGA